MEFLFGPSKPPPTLKERSREWTRGLTKEMRGLERDMAKMEREEQKMKADIKKLATKQQIKACATMAKALVKSQNTRQRMLTAKTQINSVCLNIKTQVATVSVAQTMQKSGQIMRGMSQLLKVPEIAKVAAAMSQEMMKAGVIDEMMNDALEAVDGEDVETEADEQVDKVLYELTSGELGKLPELKPKSRAQIAKEEDSEKESGDVKKVSAGAKKVLVAGGGGGAVKPAAKPAASAAAKPPAAAAAAKPAAAAAAKTPPAAAAAANKEDDDDDADAGAGGGESADPKQKEAQMAAELAELEEMKKRLAGL